MKKKRPIDYSEARELFDASEEKTDMCPEDNYEKCLDSYMERKGYEWNHNDDAYVDDGSEADMIADQKLQECKERDL